MIRIARQRQAHAAHLSERNESLAAQSPVSSAQPKFVFGKKDRDFERAEVPSRRDQHECQPESQAHIPFSMMIPNRDPPNRQVKQPKRAEETNRRPIRGSPHD